MSVIFKIEKVDQRMVDTLVVAIKLFKDYPERLTYLNFSCLKIRKAAIVVVGGEANFIEQLLEDYEAYTTERVFPDHWQEHKDFVKWASFDSFFSQQWPEVEKRNEARETALRQFTNNLKHRLENQQ